MKSWTGFLWSVCLACTQFCIVLQLICSVTCILITLKALSLSKLLLLELSLHRRCFCTPRWQAQVLLKLRRSFFEVNFRCAYAYSTLIRLRTKFKADMVDHSLEIDTSLQSLQPLRSSHVGVTDTADSFARLHRRCVNDLVLQLMKKGSYHPHAQFFVLVAHV